MRVTTHCAGIIDLLRGAVDRVPAREGQGLGDFVGIGGQAAMISRPAPAGQRGSGSFTIIPGRDQRRSRNAERLAPKTPKPCQ
jgi:hypothetical protein